MYYRLARVINVRGMKKMRTQAPDLKDYQGEEAPGAGWHGSYW